MTYDEDIDKLRKLLEIYRGNLSHFLEQAAIYGGIKLSPTQVVYGIREAQTAIALLEAKIAELDKTPLSSSSPFSSVLFTTELERERVETLPLYPPPQPKTTLLWYIWTWGSAVGIVLLLLSICMTVLFKHFTRDTLASVIVMLISLFTYIIAVFKSQDCIWELGAIQAVGAVCALILITLAPVDISNTSLSTIGYIVVTGAGLSCILSLLSNFPYGTGQID